eukprot:6845209-Pyramimonas_sp.AAC.1
MTKKPKGENDDSNSSLLLQGFYRPDFSLPRTNRDGVPELDELVMQCERGDLAQSRGVDFINMGCGNKRTTHACLQQCAGAFQQGPQGQTCQF